MADETAPLLGFWGDEERDTDHHAHYCSLVGVPPSDLPANKLKAFKAHPTSLYERAKRKRASTTCTYQVTACLSNTLLLSQVVLGAALTALGAAESSHILITIFGAANTIIAGVVAYLKSRGQPMRARMFRDDLERVVDEIENSETMWLGITKHIHGYDEIDIDDQVSVRSEVARLTKLYDRAVRNNTANNPDMYMAAGGADALASLRARPGPGMPAVPAVGAAPAANTSAAVPAPAVAPEEESPATAKPKPKEDEVKDKAADDKKEESKGAAVDQVDKKDDTSKSNTGANGPSKAQSPPTQAGSAPEPPEGTPLADDVDEGPVTAPTKPKGSNGGNGN